MKTSEQVEREFMRELDELLSKYGAEIETVYTDPSAADEIEVNIPAVYDYDGDRSREYTEINLGKFYKP